MDIRVSVNLTFFLRIWLFLALFEPSCTGNTGYKTEPQFFVTSVASTRVLKNSPIISKNAKFTLTLTSKKIEFFMTNSDFTLQKYMKFAFIVTFSVFLDSEWITDNVILSNTIVKRSSLSKLSSNNSIKKSLKKA